MSSITRQQQADLAKDAYDVENRRVVYTTG